MLLDTSGLLALIDAREPQHQRACDEYHRAATRITHGYVIAEFVALANARGVPPSSTLQVAAALLGDPAVTKVWPGEALTSQALTLLMARQGRGYSLCDAVSFVLMRQRNETHALTTDMHFEDEGFQRLLA